MSKNRRDAIRRLVLFPGLLAALVGTPGKVLPQVQAFPGSPHDFSTSQSWPGGLDGENNDSCVLCHLPSREIAGDPAGLSSQQGSYRMYDSPTMDARRPPGPTGASLACLACHDGVIAPEAPTGEESALGTDLSDDHPISIEYDPFLDPGLRPIQDVVRSGLKLFNEGGVQKVQCASCHDPHGGREVGRYLRMDNAGSGLCLTCHDK